MKCLQLKIEYFDIVQLLCYNLYCLKRYINKADLTWLEMRVFPQKQTKRVWLSPEWKYADVGCVPANQLQALNLTLQIQTLSHPEASFHW